MKIEVRALDKFQILVRVQSLMSLNYLIVEIRKWESNDTFLSLCFVDVYCNIIKWLDINHTIFNFLAISVQLIAS